MPEAARRSGGAEGNQRLTAITGAVLLVLLAVEGFTILRVGRLLTLHFFLGMLLLGPVAYHRLVFRRGMKEPLVKYANLMAVLGLAAVGAAVLTAVLLVTSYVVGALPAGLITALVACMLVGLWFALPLARRGE